MPARKVSAHHSRVKKTLGVSFKNPLLLDAALLHPSHRNENPCPRNLEDFDRLEFFGDAILNYIICRKIYQMFPEANEGMLSRLRSILVSRRILSRVAKELRLSRCLKLGKSLTKQPGFSKDKILCDSLEALFGVLYFDQGLAKTEKFILRHFKPYLDAKRLLRLDPNPKGTLQELCQKEWQKIPIYSNVPASRGIKVEVMVPRIAKSVGVGRTRREAEEKAARVLIRRLRQELVRRSRKLSSGAKLLKIF